LLYLDNTYPKMGNHKLLNNQMVQRPLQQIIDGGVRLA
jgi:hypothetical protein